MKVLINAVSARWGGAATYIKNLARELAVTGSTDEYIFWVPEVQARSMRGLAPHIKIFSSDPWTSRLSKRFLWEQVVLP